MSTLTLRVETLKDTTILLLTLVFRSTHSSHDNVGLLRFCFFLGGSEVDGDPLPLLKSCDAAKVAGSVGMLGDAAGRLTGDTGSIMLCD